MQTPPGLGAGRTQNRYFFVENRIGPLKHRGQRERRQVPDFGFHRIFDHAADAHAGQAHHHDFPGRIARRGTYPCLVHDVDFMLGNLLFGTVRLDDRGADQFQFRRHRIVHEFQFGIIANAPEAQDFFADFFGPDPFRGSFKFVIDQPFQINGVGLGHQFRLGGFDFKHRRLFVFELHQAQRLFQAEILFRRDVRVRERGMVASGDFPVFQLNRLVPCKNARIDFLKFRQHFRPQFARNRQHKRFVRRTGGEQLHRVFALRQPGRVQHEIHRAETAPDPRRRKQRLTGIPDQEVRGRIGQDQLQRLVHVIQIFGEQPQFRQRSSRHHAQQLAGDELPHLFRLPTGKRAAVHVVVNTVKGQRGSRRQRAVAVERTGGIDLHLVPGGGNHRRSLKRFARRRRHQIAHIGQIGGENFRRGFIGRVHQHVRPVFHPHAGDRMVEIAVRHLAVFFRAAVEQHRISLQAGKPEHGRQQRRLVAADPVAFFKRDVDVVGFESGRFGLQRQPRVTDFARNELENRVDLLDFSRFPGGQFLHLGFHFRRHLVQVRRGNIPVPARNLQPVGGGADQQPLRHHVSGRHGGFVENLRHVAGGPAVHDPAVLFRLIERDRSFHLVLDDPAFERKLRRGVDDIFVIMNRRAGLKHNKVRPYAADTLPERGLAAGHVDHVADLQVGNGHLQQPLVGVVNIGLHLARFGHDFGVRRHVDRRDRAVGTDHFKRDHFDFVVTGVEMELKGPAFPAAFFGQDFLVIVIDRRSQRLPVVFADLIVADQDTVGVGVFPSGGLRGEFTDFIKGEIGGGKPPGT